MMDKIKAAMDSLSYTLSKNGYSADFELHMSLNDWHMFCVMWNHQLGSLRCIQPKDREIKLAGPGGYYIVRVKE